MNRKNETIKIINSIKDASSEITSMALFDLDTVIYGTDEGKIFSYSSKTGIVSCILDGDGSSILKIIKYKETFVFLTHKGIFTDENSTFKKDLGLGLKTFANYDSVFAFGGEERDLFLFDLVSNEIFFEAENVENDFLDIRQAISISDIRFMKNGNKLVTITKYSQIRVYDTKIQNQPLFSFDVGKHPLTAMSLISDDFVFVGDSTGNLMKICLKTGRLLGKYFSPVGGISSIQIKDEILIASSIDRNIHVFSVSSRKLIRKIYLKNRINDLIFSTFTDKLILDEMTEDDIWDSMQKI